MTEYLVGFLIGLIAGSAFYTWCIRSTLKYKSDTGIDMCIGGKFYTVRRNLERERAFDRND